MKTQIQVIVGNIGTVYSGGRMKVAEKIFNEFSQAAKSKAGRVAGENVTMIQGDEIIKENIGNEN